MTVTNENLVFQQSNHRLHLPIFKGDDGVEYVPTPDGQRFVPVSTLNLSNARREAVNRK